MLKVERGPFVEQDGGRIAYVVDGDSAVTPPDPHRRQQPQRGRDRSTACKAGDRIVVSGTDQFGDAERVAIN